jgi:hypothetical protein
MSVSSKVTSIDYTALTKAFLYIPESSALIASNIDGKLYFTAFLNALSSFSPSKLSSILITSKTNLPIYLAAHSLVFPRFVALLLPSKKSPSLILFNIIGLVNWLLAESSAKCIATHTFLCKSCSFTRASKLDGVK